jgi:hypothetical protein
VLATSVTTAPQPPASWVRGWRLRIDACVAGPLSDWLRASFCAYRAPEDAPPVAVIHRLPEPPCTLPGAPTPLMVDEVTLLLRSAFPTGESPCGFQLTHPHGDGGCDARQQAGGSWRLGYWGEEPRVALYTAVTEAFRANGWLSVHASASVNLRDGPPLAHLSLGASGAGKSFQLLHDVGSGRSPLGEDRVWIQADGLVAMARDAAVRVRPDAFEHFTWLRAADAVRHPDGKFAVSYERLGVVPAPPTRIVAVSVPRACTPSHSLAAAQAAWQAVGLPFTAAGRRHATRAVAALVPMFR